MTRMVAVATACVACLGIPSMSAAQESRTLEVEDLFRLKAVGSPVVSPDGQWVAYTVSTTHYDAGERRTRLWIAPTAGGDRAGLDDPIPMTLESSSVSAPAWSPDGRWLSFLTARDGGEAGEKTQVWALDRRGGEAVALTDVEQGVSGYAWSPDATRLLLTIRDPERGGTDPDTAASDSAGSEADGAAARGSEDDAPRPHIIDRLQFKRDYAGYLDRRRTHLYVYQLGTERLIPLTGGDHDDSGAAWSPDGRQVVFVSNRTADPDANSNTDLWVVDVPALDGSAPDPTDPPLPSPRRLTTNEGSDGAPAWSPDGRWIAYVRDTQPHRIWYAVNELAVVPAAGGEPRPLVPGLDRNVYSPAFDPDGRVWFRIEDSGEVHLARVRVDGRGLERVVTGERVVSRVDVGPEGSVALLLGTVDGPDEVHVLERRGPRRITAVNDSLLGVLRLGEVRNFTATSTDGTPVEGWLTLPPAYRPGDRYPTLLRIHGGPVAQYDWRFDFESQLFAAHGYVVVRANPRGSSGYGQAFSEAIWADWGNLDYEDVMAAVNHAVAGGWADPDRLGVGGWSYGGILTNYIITKTDRFRGAITGASEVLYRSNYGHDHYQQQWEAELGLPWENPEAWDRISPFTYVQNIITPTLIMGGAVDWNVPILNSEQLYQALKRLGRETVLVVYPGEHHGIRTPAFQRDRLERYLDWYGRYVKGERDPASYRADWRGALDRLER